jgi:hypothetical protein
LLPRRRVLAASAAAVPVLLATAGCRSSDAFAGPDPLAGRPTLSPDVVALQAVIAAEQAMITLYQSAVASHLATAVPTTGPTTGPITGAATGRAGVLEELLAQHRQHLGQLQARLVRPAGWPSAQVSSSASPGAAPVPVTIARLRAAESASATDLVGRLVSMPPALAQLFASIAASDATHVVALGG